jgi:hypothetical protein
MNSFPEFRILSLGNIEKLLQTADFHKEKSL